MFSYIVEMCDHKNSILLSRDSLMHETQVGSVKMQNNVEIRNWEKSQQYYNSM